MMIIYTIGHARHTLEYFMHLLRASNVDCVVDVRCRTSDPYAPQYDAATLSAYLKGQGINYLDFSNEFTSCSFDTTVAYYIATATPSFLNGIARLTTGAQRGFHIVLMGSEANPTQCHRFNFIARYLSQHDIEVRHIMADGRVLNNDDLKTGHQQSAPTTENTMPKFVFIDAIMLAIRLGKVRRPEQREALLTAARAANDPLTFMTAAEHFGLRHNTPLMSFMGQVLAAPTYYRERYAQTLGILTKGVEPEAFLNNTRALYIIEPLLNDTQRHQFSELYWWFVNNHNTKVFNRKTNSIQIGAYATAPRDNTSVLQRFEAYLNRLANSTKVTVRKKYQGFPFDIIIEIEKRAFLTQN